jgi:hypothetical protein
MMRVIQTRGRSPTWRSKTSKPLRVRSRIYMTNSQRWQGGLRRFQKCEKENDLTRFFLVYDNMYDCRCNENSCFDKVCWTWSLFFFKMGDPIPYPSTVNTAVNICQNMSICSRLPTYVKICSYVICCQHLDGPRFRLSSPKILYRFTRAKSSPEILYRFIRTTTSSTTTTRRSPHS